MSEHEPRFAEGMERWVFVGDWLAYRLSGVLASDYSITSQTLTLDQTRAWPARGPAASVRPRRGPVPVARAGGRGRSARSPSEAARGHRSALPGYRSCWAAPTGWSVCLASGLTEPGDVGILTGTWELTFTCAREPCLTAVACESGAICDPHVAPERWALRIEALSGEVTEWCRRQLAGDGGRER